MATVTKPIALDESLNTTELSSRNVADVLAQELSAVATAIGGIAVPSADHVSYDNSVSGLSATDVQNALDEIVSDIPTVNNGTLTIQQNGTSIGSFSANTASNVTANIKTPTADKKTATSEFSTADGGLLSKCQINLVPVQSGSGDPAPDNIRPISGHTEVDLQVDSKNFLPLPTAETKSGITLTHLSDGSIKIEGTSTANVYFDFFAGNFNSTYYAGYKFFYTISGMTSAYFRISDSDRIGIQNIQTPNEFISIADVGNNLYFALRIANGTAIPTGGAIIKAILVKPSETDPTFAPYLGHLYQVQIGSTVYGGYVDLVSGVMTVDKGIVDLGSLNWTYDSANTRFKGENMPSDYKRPSSYSERYQNMACSCYKPNDSPIITTRVDNTISGYEGSNNIYLYDFAYTDGSALKTARTGQKLVYPLDTLLTIQLTHQQIEALVGQNNLSTPLDGQSIETNGVEYKELFTFADVKEYVDKKIPDAPTTDGTYTLQAVVSGGVPTYSWV